MPNTPYTLSKDAVKSIQAKFDLTEQEVLDLFTEGEIRHFGSKQALISWLFLDDEGDRSETAHKLLAANPKDMLGYDTVGDYLIASNDRTLQLEYDHWVFVF